MSTQLNTNLRHLWKDALDSRSVIAMSLLPEVSRALYHRLGVTDGELFEKSIARRLQAIGVDEVFFDYSPCSAQNAMEAAELVRRIKEGQAAPLLLDSCPSWQAQCPGEWASLFAPLRQNARVRGLAIRSMLSARRGVAFSRIVHVTVVRCAACKEQYGRLQTDPASCIGKEYVIGVRDLLLWLGLEGKLPKEAHSSATPPCFCGRLCGVLSHAAFLLEGIERPPASFELTATPGYGALLQGSARIGGTTLRYAQLRGLSDAERLLQRAKDYDLIEVFSCAACG